MQNFDFGEPQDLTCPFCQSSRIEHTVESQPVRFPYGPGLVLMATVKVDVPVTVCSDCKKAWTDARAEPLREAAVEQRLSELNA